MVFLCVLCVAGFASRGIQLIIWMHSLRRCDCVVFYVHGVAGFASSGIHLIILMHSLRKCDCGVFVYPWCCWICF